MYINEILLRKNTIWELSLANFSFVVVGSYYSGWADYTLNVYLGGKNTLIEIYETILFLFCSVRGFKWL